MATDTLAIDLDAPILPGHAAAGIALGTTAASVIAAATTAGYSFSSAALVNGCIQAETGTIRYESPAVDFWATDGVIDQVMVHGGYRGALAGDSHVRVGVSLAAVETPAGGVRRHASGVVALPGVSGASLELAQDSADSTISAIYVFAP